MQQKTSEVEGKLATSWEMPLARNQSTPSLWRPHIVFLPFSAQTKVVPVRGEQA